MKVRGTNRRSALALVVGTLAGSAGCVSLPTDWNTEAERPRCEELLRVRVTDSIDGDTVNGFELRLVETPVVVGDPLVVVLRNTTDETGVTGNRHKYVVQRQTDGAWESVQRVDEDGFWTDETAGHPANEGFRWEFDFSKDGLTRENDRNADYHVCEELSPGTYRFVYFGLLGDTAAASDPFTIARGGDGSRDD